MHASKCREHKRLRAYGLRDTRPGRGVVESPMGRIVVSRRPDGNDQDGLCASLTNRRRHTRCHTASCLTYTILPAWSTQSVEFAAQRWSRPVRILSVTTSLTLINNGSSGRRGCQCCVPRALALEVDRSSDAVCSPSQELGCLKFWPGWWHHELSFRAMIQSDGTRTQTPVVFRADLSSLRMC